jgi:hypothetical protein
MRRMLLGLLAVFLTGSIALAQEASPFPPEAPATGFDALVQQMKFEKPTRIVGRLLAFDTYDDAVWIEWTHRHDGSRWSPVGGEMQFVVYPRDPGMMAFFKKLKLGTTLHMTVQMDADGNRRVLELEGT